MPRSAAPHLHQLSQQVFASSYIEAMRWALAVPVAILIGGALACLTMRREVGPASVPASAGLAAAASVGEA
jgi:hypothetical protein